MCSGTPSLAERLSADFDAGRAAAKMRVHERAMAGGHAEHARDLLDGRPGRVRSADAHRHAALFKTLLDDGGDLRNCAGVAAPRPGPVGSRKPLSPSTCIRAPIWPAPTPKLISRDGPSMRYQASTSAVPISSSKTLVTPSRAA